MKKRFLAFFCTAILFLPLAMAESCEELGGKELCNEFQICANGELVNSDDEGYDCCTGNCADLPRAEMIEKLSYQYSPEDAARLAEEYLSVSEGLIETAEVQHMQESGESDIQEAKADRSSFLQKYWILIILIGVLLALATALTLLYYRNSKRREIPQ